MQWVPSAVHTCRACASLLAPFAFAIAGGCSANTVATSDASTTTTVAIISYERSQPASGQRPAADVEAGARPAIEGDTGAAPTVSTPASLYASAFFLRIQAGADEQLAARVVGADFVIPEPNRCAPVEPLRDEGIHLSSLGPIDLVDVGEVSVEAAGARATLAARVFPDLVDLISGVVYTTRDGLGSSLPERGRYQLRATGSATFGATALSANAPGAVTGITVGGLSLDRAPLALPRNDVEIDWQASGGDEIYVELASTDDGPVERVRCTFADNGHGVVPGNVLPRSASQRLSIHRLHRERLIDTGVDSGEVRFDEAVTANVRFEVKGP